LNQPGKDSKKNFTVAPAITDVNRKINKLAIHEIVFPP
jgi:hypothetical protein